MKKKIFIDSDIILDLLLERKPFFSPSAELFNLIEDKKIHASVSALHFSNLFYIIRKVKGKESAKTVLRKLKILVKVLSVDEKVIELALESDFSDFEDAIQYYACLDNKIDVIITRNKGDFRNSKLPVMTAEEFIAVLKLKD
ncbi:MAG: PIN domain-containing protein [Candidatus Delongbacteria bacterium]|nr:PIN domain-containing protein [Candidatus Delongbacteria bacterium]MCG2759882.1 PIN domain-containing protein [Candidatus Delongbacteria bacterium]